jgi:hypothetical protein
MTQEIIIIIIFQLKSTIESSDQAESSTQSRACDASDASDATVDLVIEGKPYIPAVLGHENGKFHTNYFCTRLHTIALLTSGKGSTNCSKWFVAMMKALRELY